jgi:hypothetical protein
MWKNMEYRPDEAAFYLIYVAGEFNEIRMAWWDVYYNRFVTSCEPVTHWMPLPAPPTAEVSGGATANVPQQGQ